MDRKVEMTSLSVEDKRVVKNAVREMATSTLLLYDIRNQLQLRANAVDDPVKSANIRYMMESITDFDIGLKQLYQQMFMRLDIKGDL
jgi:hypothetical protein